jgi:hypothetical protein
MLAVAAFAAAFQSSTSANHSWGGYHWARTSLPLNLKLGDNVSTIWDQHLTDASSDWSESTVLNTEVVAGGANSKNCRPTSGRVEVCNSAYGNNGWLGIAQIWITGGTHITQGTTKLNDTYFKTAKYNTPAWRQFVTCQEVGHTFGLDHQDENFNNANLGTCMDYTNDPSTNQHPNAHDYEELITIYSHLDSTTTARPSPAFGGAQVESPNEWGQLMKVSHGGRTQVFERDFGNGQKIITFVIWA